MPFPFEVVLLFVLRSLGPGSEGPSRGGGRGLLAPVMSGRLLIEKSACIKASPLFVNTVSPQSNSLQIPITGSVVVGGHLQGLATDSVELGMSGIKQERGIDLEGVQDDIISRAHGTRVRIRASADTCARDRTRVRTRGCKVACSTCCVILSGQSRDWNHSCWRYSRRCISTTSTIVSNSSLPA